MTVLQQPPTQATADEAGAAPARGRMRRARSGARWSSFQITSLIVVLLVLAAIGYPLVRILLQAMHTSAVRDLVHHQGLAGIIGNTALVVGVSALLALLLGSLLAWANERTDARMGAITDTLPFLPFMIPPIAGAIGWVLLLAPSGGYANSVIRLLAAKVGWHMTSGPINIYSLYGLILVYTIYMIPYVFLIVSAGIRNLDPQLEEQSRVSGAGALKTFVRVILPGLAPSLASSALMVVWTGFAMFAVPQAIATPAHIGILSVETVNVITFQFPPDISLGVMLSLVTMVFVGIAWYLQSRVRSRSRHAVVGGRGARAATRTRLGWARLPVRALMVLFMLVVTVLPALALLMVSLSGYWSPHIAWNHLSLRAFQATFNDPGTQSAIVNSFKLGLEVATVGAVLAALASVLVIGRRGRAIRLLDGSLKLPVIISPLVIAIGFVLCFSGPPFNLGGTMLILFVAYLVLSVPQGTVSTDAAAAQVGDDLREASLISGAGGWRTFARVYFPLMLPAVAIAWALMFVRVLGDLEISAILAGTGNPTIGYQTMMLYNAGSYGEVASLTLLVLVISAVVVSVVLAVARRRSRWSLSTSTVPGGV